MPRRAEPILALALVLAVSGVCAVTISANVNTARATNTLRPEAISTTIDFSIILNGDWANFTAPRFLTLASEYVQSGATLLRIGGTRGDVQYYDMSESPAPNPPPPYLRVFTREMADNICTLATTIGVSIVFGLNAGNGPRDANGEWDASNALQLMQYFQSIDCPIAGFEFGNEPNLFETTFGFFVNASQFARDVPRFVSTVKSFNSSLITITADTSFLPLFGELYPFYENMLSEIKPPFPDVMSYHFYPTLSGKYNHTIPAPIDPFYATPQKLIDPFILDQIQHWQSVVSALKAKYLPASTQIWLGETSSAVGAGQTGTSDRFCDGFEYWDKIGTVLSSASTEAGNSQLLFRQTIQGYPYGLLDFNIDAVPRASFFSSLILKRVIGLAGLGVTSTDSFGFVRTYAFCARTDSGAPYPAPNGAVVVMAINLQTNTSQPIDFLLNAAPYSGAGFTRSDYVFTPPDGVLDHPRIQLNGAVLDADNSGRVPPLPPVVVTDSASTPTASTVLPPLSYSLFVLNHANSPVC